MRLDLGSPVHCNDGAAGEICDVVVEPRSLTLTHLVVEPRHHHGRARLVPLDHVSVDESGVSLDYDADELAQLPRVQEFSHLHLGEPQRADPDWDVGVETVLATPAPPGWGRYGAVGAYGGYGDYSEGLGEYGQAYSVVFDRVPKGEVEISRAGRVEAADGRTVGRVVGFLVETNGALTHLVLRRGHLWGRRLVTIPVNAVSRLATDAITLRLAKTDVGAHRLARAR
jgi:hypothetical protein